MSSSKIIKPFYNMTEMQNQDTSFFFLEHLLKARADLHMESGQHECDQEVNVYLTGLLNSLIGSDTFLKQKPYISPFDIEVREYLELHPGLRNQYTVYRENADFGLILLGIFLGYQHCGSYQHIVLSDVDEKGRISLYYELAASALSHLKGNDLTLVSVYLTLAEFLPEILQILRRAASSYFDFISQISPGSMFHLEKEINEEAVKKLYEKKLDEFLKLYSSYKEDPSVEQQQKIMGIVTELKKLNSDFKFDL